MSLQVSTSAYRLYQEVVGPLCGLLLGILVIVASAFAIFVALEIAVTASNEGTSFALPLLVAAVALFLGGSAIGVALDEEDLMALVFLLFCTAVACWIVIGIHLAIRTPVTHYSEQEVRVTHDRKVVLPGQSVPRGFRTAQSEVVELNNLTRDFKLDVVLPNDNLIAIVTYTTSMFTYQNKHAVVQSILDADPKIPVDRIASEIVQKTQELAQNSVRSFVKAMGILAVGRQIPDRPEQLAFLKIERFELVRR